jgi:hypothetical protein
MPRSLRLVSRPRDVHARALWQGNTMREVCDLPGDCMIERTGTEWLLQLLCKLYENQRARTSCGMRNVLFLHNELTYSKPAPNDGGFETLPC